MSSPGSPPGPIRGKSTDTRHLALINRRLREDLLAIVRAAIDGVDAGGLVRRALADADVVAPLQRAAAVDVIAAGKASGVMLTAFAAATAVPSCVARGAMW